MEFSVAVTVAKGQCIGTLIRCASAFGARELLIVGSLNYSTHGAHGAQKKSLPVLHFPDYEQLVTFLEKERNLNKIYGILPNAGFITEEIKDNTLSLRDVTFTTKTSDSSPSPSYTCFFMPQKAFLGLSPEEIKICSNLIYVPFPNLPLELTSYNKQKSPSLDYHVHMDAKLSIILESFSNVAGFSSRTFTGHKFDVDKSLETRRKATDLMASHHRGSKKETEMKSGEDPLKDSENHELGEKKIKLDQN